MEMINLERPRANPNLRPILLVEDNDMDLDFMLHVLRENKVLNPLSTCRDGEQALDFMNAHSVITDPQLPVLVLMDLNLSRLDGASVLYQARQKPVWKQIPIIIMSTSREDQDIRRVNGLGGNSYIIKPLGFESFVDVVKRIKAYWLQTSALPFPETNGRS